MRSVRAPALWFGLAVLSACGPTRIQVESESCDAPSRFVVSLVAGTCSDVSAPNGFWQAASAVSDAPTDVRASFCELSWAGEAAPTEADRAPVRALDGAEATVGALCSDPDDEAVESEVASGGTGGSVGCDVCRFNGMVRNRMLFAVLPPAQADQVQRVAYVRTTDGGEATILFTPKRARQSFVVVRLPSTLQFRDERVSVE